MRDFESGTMNATTSCNDQTFTVDDVVEKEFDFSPQDSSATIDVSYTGDRPLQLANQRPFNRTDLDTTPGVSTPRGCSQTNNSAVDLDGNTTANYTIEFSCDTGQHINGTFSKKLEVGDDNHTEYNYTGYFNISSNETRFIDILQDIPKSNLTDFSDRTSPPTGYLDGSPDGVFHDVKTTTVELNYSTDCCSSSPSTGLHSYTLNYKVDEEDTTAEPDNSGDGGGGGGGGGVGGGGTTTIIRNVTGDAYSWTVSAPGSGGQRFQFFGYPGRTFSAPLELENTGSGSVNLSLQCISSDGSCQWVDLSTDNVRFDASSFTETTVMVQGQVPLNATRSEYNFVVRVTDPSFNPQNPSAGGKGDVRFSVDMNRPLGFLIERYGRLAGVYTTLEVPDRAPLPEDAQGLPVPFVLIPLFISGAVFAVARAVDDSGGAVLAAHILLAVFVFILAAGLFPAWPIL